MSVHLIVPVKSLAHGKTRLSTVLSPAARADLTAGLLVHVLGAAAQVAAISSVTVISGDPEARDIAVSLNADVLADPAGGGLNGALEYAAAFARDAEGILVLPVDLPLVDPGDITAMLAADGVALAPNRSGTGTNALYRPGSATLPFRFGPGSFAAHRDAARDAGLALHIVRRDGLAFDLDTPDDYAEWISGSRSPRNRSAG